METAAKHGLVHPASNDIVDDLALVAASANGYIAAFETLVGRYDRKLLRIALRITDNREDAQEAVLVPSLSHVIPATV
ncbi:MAG TPA: hypothetical protein VMT53_25510 [Terriglobales bacterium]|nr:hypothetical protein [Terriglobales bacterium]